MLKRLKQLAEAQEKKREAAAKLLSRPRSTSSTKPATPPPAVEARVPESIASKAPPVASLAGRAGVPLYRDDDVEPSKVSRGLVQLVDLYLHAAKHRTKHIALAWPASPSTLPLVHALATLERWQDGDKLGVRGLLYPAKSSVFYPVNHLHLDRAAVLRHAGALLEVSPNPAVVRSLREKDAFLFALNSLKPEAREQFNPSVTELLPSFYAGVGFQHWSPCGENLLAHLGAKLSRRAQAKALKANCDIVGHPRSAPDALFALDGRMTEAETDAALKALARDGAPEVALILATRDVRGPSSGWRGRIARFCRKLESVFGANCPGIVVVVDEPYAAGALRDELWELHRKLERRGLESDLAPAFTTLGVPFTVGADGLLAPEQIEVVAPVPRELDVHVVDGEVAKVVRRLLRVASVAPGGRDAARPVIDCATYLTRLAALPCGVADLTDYLSAPEISTGTRATFDWLGQIAALNQFEREGGVPGHRAEIQTCITAGSDLFRKYQAATPFAMRLAQLVENAAQSRGGVLVVFTSALGKLLAERFLNRYSDFASGKRFADFQDRVHLIPVAQLDEALGRYRGAQVIFAGLNQEALRFVVTDDRLPHHAPVLLTQRNAQVLRNGLQPIVTKFPEFKSFKPRIESLLRQVADVPEDSSVLASTDYTLPTFRVELTADVSNGPGEMDPEAWRILLEGGASLFRKPTHKIYIYDPASHLASDKGFRPTEVSSLSLGDKVFVMSAELRELVEQVLRDAGVQIQSDKTFEGALRAYHQQVTEKLRTHFPGKSTSDQVRALRSAMLAINPKLGSELPGEQAMRHWVDLGQSTNTPFEQLRPQAPLKEANFQAFAEALHFSKLEAAYLWQRVILAIRNSRRLDGRHVSDIYAYMLLQPESAMVHSNITRKTLQLLFDRARACVWTVEAVGPANAGNMK